MLKKSAAAFIGVLLAGVCGLSPAWSAGEEDWKELGIETEGGKSSASEAIAKATALTDKYEKAKGRVVEAFGGGSAAPAKTVSDKPPAEEKKEKSVFEKPTDARESAYDPYNSPRKDIVHLKNGQELSGVAVVETTPKGYWVEMEGGRIFFDKSEVIEIKKQ